MGEFGGINLFEFAANNPIDDGDFQGLASVAGPGGLGGFSGPFRPPAGPWGGAALGGAVGGFIGQLGSDYGNNMMDDCPGKNCKKSACESCCKKGRNWSAAAMELGYLQVAWQLGGQVLDC